MQAQAQACLMTYVHSHEGARTGARSIVAAVILWRRRRVVRVIRLLDYFRFCRSLRLCGRLRLGTTSCAVARRRTAAGCIVLGRVSCAQARTLSIAQSKTSQSVHVAMLCLGSASMRFPVNRVRSLQTKSPAERGTCTA